MAAYTGIGSRQTPAEIVGVMEDAAFRLARIGFTLRSGKAKGADEAFQLGAQRYHSLFPDVIYSKVAEIYIPWKGFKGGDELTNVYDITLDSVDKRFPDQADMRWDWVKEVHGGWERLSQGARKLHERNIHQLFGENLSDAFLNQSKFVLYYAPETRKGDPKGGTATAVNLAKKSSIRTLNLLHDKNHEVLEKFLVSMEEKRGI